MELHSGTVESTWKRSRTERKELRVGFTKSVVVTWTDGVNSMFKKVSGVLASEMNLVSV